MPADHEIVPEKLDQAVELLRSLGLHVWLTFARETEMMKDPCLDLIVGTGLTWHSALLLTARGEKIAIVGRFDADNIRAIGGYDEVLSYDHSIRPLLKEVLARLDPGSIALNYSTSDPAADGLAHGMYQSLLETFIDTPYADRFVSAERLVSALRGRKSEAEVARIRAAIRITERLYKELTGDLRPGLSEQQIAAKMHARVAELGLKTAWEEIYCPTANAGPESKVGHAAPGKLRLKRGHLLHMDFGLLRDGYCSDLQRMWYVVDKADRARSPAEVRSAWQACWEAIDAAAERLRPGVTGWEVDEAARSCLVKAGYPEYPHALGHHLGRSVHDGATLLGPRWDRYGTTPYGIVEAGNVFTLELGTMVPGRGYIGLEEDVVVTDDGIEWLSRPQRQLWLIE